MKFETPPQPEKENERNKKLLDVLREMKTEGAAEALRLAQEIVEENEHLREQATIDELTGLKNRRGFKREVNKIFLQVKDLEKNDVHREHVKIDDLSIVFVDIDNFKAINDAVGHVVGDQVLQIVAEKMREAFRDSDQFGRWGGEELVVAMVGSDESAAFSKAQNLRRFLTEIEIPSHPDIKVSASIGVASVKDSNAGDLEELIGFADEAMYEAKTKRGKDNVVSHQEITQK